MEITTIKTFVKQNKTKIIGSALVIGGLLGIGGAYLYIKGYNRGTRNAIFITFHGTIKWFDETFDNLHLNDLWEQWKTLHPEQVVH